MRLTQIVMALFLAGCASQTAVVTPPPPPPKISPLDYLKDYTPKYETDAHIQLSIEGAQPWHYKRLDELIDQSLVVITASSVQEEVDQMNDIINAAKPITKSEKSSTLSKTLENCHFDCDTRSLVMRAMAQVRKRSFSLIDTRKHMLLRYQYPDGTYDFFDTNINIQWKDAEHLMTYFNVAVTSLATGTYLKPYSREKLISHAYLCKGLGITEKNTTEKSRRKAIEAYSAALLYDETNILAYYNRAHDLHELGQHSLALKDVNKALQLDPYYDGIYRLGERILFILERTDEANAYAILADQYKKLNEEMKKKATPTSAQ